MITSAHAKQLGSQTQNTDIGAQKIDGLLLETYDIIIGTFQVIDKLDKVCFFLEKFLLADTSIEVVLRMLFLTSSNADI